jgi:DNA repair protein RadC
LQNGLRLWNLIQRSAYYIQSHFPYQTVRLVLATSILLYHNHPSGSLKPSQNDIELTQRITEAAKYMDIVVQDHIIVIFEPGKYYSFADEGLI